MPNPVGVQDLQARFPRPFTDVEKSMAVALLADAWEELLARVPSLEARMSSGLAREGLVIRVVSAMVNRVLRNPEAIRQWTVDQDSFTRDSALSAGLLYATEDEVGLLAGQPTAGAPPISFSAGYSHLPWTHHHHHRRERL